MAVNTAATTTHVKATPPDKNEHEGGRVRASSAAGGGRLATENISVKQRPSRGRSGARGGGGQRGDTLVALRRADPPRTWSITSPGSARARWQSTRRQAKGGGLTAERPCGFQRAREGGGAKEERGGVWKMREWKNEKEGGWPSCVVCRPPPARRRHVHALACSLTPLPPARARGTHRPAAEAERLAGRVRWSWPGRARYMPVQQPRSGHGPRMSCLLKHCAIYGVPCAGGARCCPACPATGPGGKEQRPASASRCSKNIPDGRRADTLSGSCRRSLSDDVWRRLSEAAAATSRTTRQGWEGGEGGGQM